MKAVYTFIFGERTIGEKPKQPSFKSTYPAEQLEYNEWLTTTLDQLRTKRKLSRKKRVARSIKKT